jgi:acyl-CoA-binding protein
VAELDDDFAAAARTATELGADPGTEVKLRLYALYKQATVGDIAGKRPGFTNPVGRAKYDAWASVAGMPADEAKRAYVGLVDELRDRR